MVRGLSKSAEILADNDFNIVAATNFFEDEFYVLKVGKATEGYEFWRKLLLPDSEHKEQFEQVFSDIAEVINEGRYKDKERNERIKIRFVVCEHNINLSDGEDDWRNAYIASRQGTNNQALFDFEDGNKLTRYGLNFRSKTEIKIYEELVKRELFILPLPVAILGNHSQRREPDFVIAYQGKVGVLEIHGKQWHPPETASQESERRRLMRNLGIAVYEVFDARKCWQQTEAVVDEFLQAFEI